LPAILHLSDIHFGSIVTDGRARTMHRFGDGDWSIPLSKHLYNEFGKVKSRFHFDPKRLYVVISGDIVYTASQAEYQIAQDFSRTLSEHLNVPRERMIFCPGNHDINWQDAKSDRSRRFDNYLSFLVEFYGDDLFRSLYPLVNWDFKVNSPRPDPTDLVSVKTFDAHSLLFASLNSCVYETEQHHYGYVSGKQLKKLEELLDMHGQSAAVRIAVLHHHIHPYPEAVKIDASQEHWIDVSTLRDGGLTERTLEKYGFDIVLHGHKHKPQLRETLVRDRASTAPLRSLFICGAGSCGVASGELEHSVPNQYEVVEILTPKRTPHLEFLRIEWREIAVTPEAEWTTSNIWTLSG
jgi:3',5'-cyclic AMP phosphodiesterase CpdA